MFRKGAVVIFRYSIDKFFIASAVTHAKIMLRRRIVTGSSHETLFFADLALFDCNCEVSVH